MKLSVITINYNNEIGLRKTLESVRSQTNKDFEYIVIDGASLDRSVDIIKEYQTCITYWISEQDKGVYNAMNKGIALANGDYCIFMNSGDVFYDSLTIEKSLQYLNGPAVICGSTVLNGGIKRAPSEISFANFVRNTLTHQSTFIRTALLKKYKYDESLKIVSDWKFWIQVLIIDNQSYKPIDLVISKFDLTGMSSVNKDLMKYEREKVLRDLIPPRILYDYVNDINLIDNSLYWQISQSKYRNNIYTLIVCMLKFISLFFKSASWINRYPLRLKNK